jgi:hypothetical protein
MAKWVKGQSGNPGGRRKHDVTVLELAREASPRAMGRLIELIEHADPRTAISAANSVLDRAFGKPTQPISGDDDKPPVQVATTPSVEALVKLSADDRAGLRAILGRAASRPEGDGEGA